MCTTPRPKSDLDEKNDENAPLSVKEEKPTLLDGAATDCIDDLLNDNDDDDLQIMEPQNALKKRRLNVSGQSQLTYSPSKTTNNSNTNTNPQISDTSDVETLINNMIVKNQWLKCQQFKVDTVDKYQRLLCRLAALRVIDESLGCLKLGTLSGCGSGTTAKNFQKLHIAITRANDDRKLLSLDEIDLPMGSNVNLDKYLSDRFGKSRTELQGSVGKPGSVWPKEGDVGVTKKGIEEQQDMMQKRYDTLKAYKKLLKKKK